MNDHDLEERLRDHLEAVSAEPPLPPFPAEEAAHARSAGRRFGGKGRLMGAAAAVVIATSAGALWWSAGSDGPSQIETGPAVDGVVPPHRVAVDPDGVQPPGSEVRGSLTVQDGSHLIGAAFPRLDADQTMNGWQAYFTIDGDPYEVWDRYVDALELGENASALNSCLVTRPDTTPTDDTAPSQMQPWYRLLPEQPLEGENRLECEAFVGQTELRLVIGERPPMALLHLQVRERGSFDAATRLFRALEARAAEQRRAAGEEPRLFERAPMPPGPAVPVAFRVDSAASRLPQPGERWDDGLDHSLDPVPDSNDAPPNAVPTGARSLMAPFQLQGACGPGTTAIMRVPGGPDEALQPFTNTEFVDDSAPGAKGEDDRGRRWVTHHMSASFGYYLDLIALDAGDGDSFVLAFNCSD